MSSSFNTSRTAASIIGNSNSSISIDVHNYQMSQSKSKEIIVVDVASNKPCRKLHPLPVSLSTFFFSERTLNGLNPLSESKPSSEESDESETNQNPDSSLDVPHVGPERLNHLSESKPSSVK